MDKLREHEHTEKLVPAALRLAKPRARPCLEIGVLAFRANPPREQGKTEEGESVALRIDTRDVRTQDTPASLP